MKPFGRYFNERVLPHAVLGGYSLLVLFPTLLILLNSFKSRGAIFESPFSFPTWESFSLAGYATVFARANFELYFANSLIVTLSSMTLVLFFGAMAAFALSEYVFFGSRLLGLYFMAGIMVPIRLATPGLLKIAAATGLVNTLTVLVLVYTAQGLPLAIFVLTQFLRQVPTEIKDAARIDGAGEYRVFFLILPLLQPAVAVVAVFVMIPIWNDLWFPLILAPGADTRTLTLGTQQFAGQYVTNWSALLAALSLAALPVLALYIVISRRLLDSFATNQR